MIAAPSPKKWVLVLNIQKGKRENRLNIKYQKYFFFRSRLKKGEIKTFIILRKKRLNTGKRKRRVRKVAGRVTQGEK
jgi:hypothetical protein